MSLLQRSNIDGKIWGHSGLCGWARRQVQTEIEAGAGQPQAKECLESPDAGDRQKKKEKKRLSHRCDSFTLLSPNNLRGKGLTPSPIRAETVPPGDEGITEGGTIPGSRNLGAWLSHILTD